MEPLFINQFNLTFEMYQEWAAHPIGKTAVKVHRNGIILRCILTFYSVCIMILGIILRDYFFMILGLALLFLALSKSLFLGKLYLKKQYKFLLRAQNSDSHVRTTNFSEKIECEAGNSVTKYSYSDIVKFTEDKNYFYLYYNEDMVLRIYKAAFILGTVNDFRDFMNFHMAENKQ